ncbi:MAG: hypothetical protein IJ184_05315 [Alphaproteobacteria bacterium]|nr:hypothetical protein [Alphaproteobacteria bacterium]
MKEKTMASNEMKQRLNKLRNRLKHKIRTATLLALTLGGSSATGAVNATIGGNKETENEAGSKIETTIKATNTEKEAGSSAAAWGGAVQIDYSLFGNLVDPAAVNQSFNDVQNEIMANIGKKVLVTKDNVGEVVNQSRMGLAIMLMHVEGFNLKFYNDGHWTVGFGNITVPKDFYEKGKGFSCDSSSEQSVKSLLAKYPQLKKQAVPLEVGMQLFDWYFTTRENGSLVKKMGAHLDGTYISENQLAAVIGVFWNNPAKGLKLCDEVKNSKGDDWKVMSHMVNLTCNSKYMKAYRKRNCFLALLYKYPEVYSALGGISEKITTYSMTDGEVNAFRNAVRAKDEAKLRKVAEDVTERLTKNIEKGRYASVVQNLTNNGMGMTDLAKVINQTNLNVLAKVETPVCQYLMDSITDRTSAEAVVGMMTRIAIASPEKGKEFLPKVYKEVADICAIEGDTNQACWYMYKRATLPEADSGAVNEALEVYTKAAEEKMKQKEFTSALNFTRAALELIGEPESKDQLKGPNLPDMEKVAMNLNKIDSYLKDNRKSVRDGNNEVNVAQLLMTGQSGRG